MIYMVVPKDGDLMHYGILGMKWGIRRFQPYSVKGRGSGKRGREIGEAAKAKRKEEKRAKRFDRKQAKLSKYDVKYQTAENQAQKDFYKAEKKSNSVLSSQKSIDKAINKAMSSQKKANRYAYKGKQVYEKILKKYPDMKMNDDTERIGQKFIDRIQTNTQNLYVGYTNRQGLTSKRKRR